MCSEIHYLVLKGSPGGSSYQRRSRKALQPISNGARDTRSNKGTICNIDEGFRGEHRWRTYVHSCIGSDIVTWQRMDIFLGFRYIVERTCVSGSRCLDIVHAPGSRKVTTYVRIPCDPACHKLRASWIEHATQAHGSIPSKSVRSNFELVLSERGVCTLVTMSDHTLHMWQPQLIWRHR